MFAKRLGLVALLVMSLSACSSSKSPNVFDEEVLTDPSEEGLEAQTDTAPVMAATDSPEFEPEAGEPAPTALPDAPQPIVAQDEPASQPMPDAMSSEQYQFQKGDTLMKLAYRFYGNVYAWREIYQMNQSVIKDVNHITPGTVLKIEKRHSGNHERPGATYAIKKGDSLAKVSESLYGAKKYWKNLWKYNEDLVRNPNKIYSGFFLYYLPIEQAQKMLDGVPAGVAWREPMTGKRKGVSEAPARFPATE